MAFDSENIRESRAGAVAANRSITGLRPIAIGSNSMSVAPRAEDSNMDIHPLAPDELRSVLNELGPSDNKETNGERPIRDRLIAEWLTFVGLRVGEVLSPNGQRGLTVHQILGIVPDPNHPFDHAVVTVIGKGNRKRNVAVPNWLVEKTIHYIRFERKRAVALLRRPSAKLFVAGINSRPIHRGKPISARAFEKALQSACIRGGAYIPVRKNLAEGGQGRWIKAARHSPHDLRHTYALMTYASEIELGNPEPLKGIQGQLGHKHLATTVDTYLAYVSVHNQWTRDLRRVSVRELAGLHR